MKSVISDEFFGQLEALALNLSPSLTGFFGGKHRTRTYGQTVEFADYREYMLGDDIRRIDWNLYSRFEKYFLKLFTDERQMHLQVFIDCSASMGKANPTKSAYAVGIAAALGYLSVHNMDKTSFKLIKNNAVEDVAGIIVGKNTFFRAISELEKLDFKGEADLTAAITSCPNPGSNDGLTVIISDFMTDHNWKKAVDYLLFKKRQVMLIQVMSPDELDPSYDGRMNLLDSEAVDVADTKNMKIRITRNLQRAYDEALKDFVGDIKTFCRSRGVDFIHARTDQDLLKMIFGELLKISMIS